MKSRTRSIALAWLAVAACSSPARPPISNQPVAGSRGIALAVVLNGWELFAGNDTLLPADDPSRYPGVLPALDAELPKLATLPGLATLIVYADHATVTRKLGATRDLTSGWFGEQKTYFNKVGVELITGLELAVKTLAEAPPELDRVILVLGDGCDTNQEMAKQRLEKLGLSGRHIALHEIQIATQLSAECAPLAGAQHHGSSLSPGIDHFVAAVR